MELFTHSAEGEDPEILEIEETAPVRELLLSSDPDGHVWVQENDEEIDLDITLDAAGIKHHHHVHRGRCRKVELVVRYNSADYVRTFGPATTIKTVEKWAFGPEAANFSPEQAAKHVLAVPGADHFLDEGVHVGSLVTVGTCKVTLDLLPRDRFAG